MTRYQPIENYALIGDLNTIALVGLDGSIDFLCLPRFDSPSIFAALLDHDKGGSFRICAADSKVKHKQLYLPDTNVLLTRFLSEGGVGETTDFMPVASMNVGRKVVRIVTCVYGELDFTMHCSPRFNYARSLHAVDNMGVDGFVFTSEEEHPTKLRLRATVPSYVDNGSITAAFSLKQGDKAVFMLEFLDEGIPPVDDISKFAEEGLYATINYWKGWAARSKYRGRWMEIVNRSALVLKSMTSSEYGSIIASPTFGLPEEIGGTRNWDYRYVWIRDASFSIYALLKLGYKREARAFISWVEKQCEEIQDGGNLHLMYTIDGRKELVELELNHLEGYKKSAPVRIGNGAYKQIQLDIYGELLDAIYLYDKYAEGISYDFWLNISRQVEWVCGHWQLSDEGIWEVRGGKREFLYSRLMCWVALDRGIRIAHRHSYPLSPRWLDERDKIFHSIHQEFWNEDLQSFVQYKGANTVDAATLLMPIVRFIGPKDPRWLSTLQRIEDKLVSDSLVYRYRADHSLDGMHGGEGTFSMCTFWYVECLARAGQLEKARLYFEKMLGYANHVGLYAEQLGLQGQHLGNFPQAFTHLGLISAALSLDSQFNDQRNKEE